MAEVQQWLQSKGGNTSKLEIREEASNERTVVAKVAIRAGEEVFSVPRSLWLTPGSLHAHPSGPLVLAWWADMREKQDEPGSLSADHLEVLLLAVLLLLERRGKPQTTSAEYLRSLPARIDHLPLTWPQERLAASLQGVSPQRGIEAKRQQLAQARASLLRRCGPQGKEAGRELAAACPTDADFIRAFALVHSRVMNINSVDAKGCPWNLAILPFADMFNHSSEPSVEWDVKMTGGSSPSAVGCVLRDVPAGAELHIRYSGAASGQAFFATYGFVDGVVGVPAELYPHWDNDEDAVLRLASGRSLRRLLSRLRVQVATREERARLDPAASPSDAARFPLSLRAERAAWELLREQVAKQGPKASTNGDADKDPAAHIVQALLAADAKGWAELDQLAVEVLADLPAAGTAPEAAVAVHRATSRMAGRGARRGCSRTYVDAAAMEAKDEGGPKGRGYYAKVGLAPGRLLLMEEPFIFDAAEDDFPALAAVHILGAAKDLRAAPNAGDEDGRRAAQWLRGMEGVSQDQAARAYAVAEANGFRATMPGAPEEDPSLLFPKLAIFNHSCLPNCAVYREASSGLARVLVTREVESGHELFIHYNDELMSLPTRLRQQYLMGCWGFRCSCPRCLGTDPAGRMVEHALLKTESGECDPTPWEGQWRLLRKQMMEGLFDDWAEARKAADEALQRVNACGPSATYWARHHARELRCLALENLAQESAQNTVAAYMALAEHIGAAWRLLPRYCQALKDLRDRLDTVGGRLPEMLRPRVEAKAAEQFGEGLAGLSDDLAQLQRWLDAAAAE